MQFADINIFTFPATGLCFEIKLPILEDNIYNHFQIVPILKIKDDNLIFIAIPEQFVYLDAQTRSYTFPAISQRRHCKDHYNINICERNTEHRTQHNKIQLFRIHA
ncbi:hypothetical protein WN55_00710 [Dufourea novaeangliae]|uniref:Uncharacterized protein n=1 Tax=Dufourea novaeangliae TaxID=178035 RepID=A0A154NY88_DUFNO|nr:hypothetical protein WN55_00710 [Dufourea novaeangliae]